MKTWQSFVAAIVGEVKAFVIQKTTPLEVSIGELRGRVNAVANGVNGKDGAQGEPGLPGKDGAPGRDGRDGVDGKSLSVEDVRPLLEQMAASLPKPADGAQGLPGEPGLPGEDGRNGVDGKDGAPGLPGKDGRDGIDGAPGKDGKPGERGADGAPGRDGKDADMAALTLQLDERLDKFFATIAAPKDGRDGKDGEPGRAGADGKSVSIEDLRPLLEQTFAAWALDIERRGMDLIQRCVDRIERPRDGVDGKDGAAGRDGRDGFGFDDLSCSMGADGRTLTFEFVRGEARKSFAFRLPHPIYRGVWREGGYLEGDSVTWGGSQWIAIRDTSAKPEFDDSWRLAVKRGRDGRDPR